MLAKENVREKSGKKLYFGSEFHAIIRDDIQIQCITGLLAGQQNRTSNGNIQPGIVEAQRGVACW